MILFQGAAAVAIRGCFDIRIRNPIVRSFQSWLGYAFWIVAFSIGFGTVSLMTC